MPKLSTDMVVLFSRRPHLVVMVNLSRAIIVPVTRTFEPPADSPAGTVNNPWPTGISISPNSELEIISLKADSLTSRPTSRPSYEPVSTDHQPDLFSL